MFKNLRKRNTLEHIKISKKKKWIIGILCLVVCGLTIGFSTFYNELIISSYAVVKPNFSTFSILFSNSSTTTDTAPVKPTVVGDAEATTAVIKNVGNPSVNRMNVVFSEPGQSATYTFYARNVGDYDAFLNNVIFDNATSKDSFKACTPVEGTSQEAVDNACNYINFSMSIDDTLTFTETKKVSNHSLPRETFEKIVITISYDANDVVLNGDFTVEFGLVTLVYSSLGDYDGENEGTGGEIPNNTLYNALLLNEAKTSSLRKAKGYIAGKKEVSFANQALRDEGLNITKDEDGAVYYFRGDVDDNHVLFAGFCWEIIRTTGTGGVKMIYDGIPSSGKCNNTGQASYIKNNAFNSSNNSPAYVGYMYGSAYKAYSKNIDTLTGNMVFGNDVTFDQTTGEYTLTDTVEVDVANWATDYTKVTNKHHYTCFTNGTTCPSVYYLQDSTTTAVYYFILVDGKTQMDMLNEMLADSTNQNNSSAKNAIDNWYKENMLDYTEKLEDTVFCNDRSVSSYGGWDKDSNASNNWLYFATYKRLNNRSPSLICPKFNDKFTVNLGSGNGDLDYPVGLITADEIAYAGGVLGQTNTNYYLYTGTSYMWSASPYSLHHMSAVGFTLHSTGYFNYNGLVDSYGLRPVVSLKPGTTISDGDGTSSNPYIVS